MFAAVAVVALVAAEAVAFPDWLAFFAGVLITSFLPPVLVAGAFYARGSSRAFCIGVLAWLLTAHWIAKISLPYATDGIELIVPRTDRGAEMPGMSALSQPGILSQPNSRCYEELGVRFRADYCAMWLLAIAAGVASVAVRWLTLSGDNQPA